MQYPISAPPRPPSSERLSLDRVQSSQPSPFSGKTSIIEGFSQWRLELAFPRQSLTNGRALSAWIASLRGAIGSFIYRPRLSGLNISGKSLATTAFATSGEIVVGGWSANQLSGLGIGHYLSISNKLFRIIVAPAFADGAGRCVISIEPQLRQNITGGTAVEFQNPTGLFALADGAGMDAITLDPDRLPEFAPLTALEVL